MFRPAAEPALVEKVRCAFVERDAQPTYEELSVEFSMPCATVRKYAAQEGWPGMRSAHLDRKLAEADAKSVMLAVVRGDHVVSRKYLNLAIVTLDKLTLTVERLEDDKAASTNAQTINTCMFAAQNLAKALHEVGIVGISKTLNDAGKEDNGRWDPKMLSQLNVTVQNIVGQTSAPAVPVATETKVSTS